MSCNHGELENDGHGAAVLQEQRGYVTSARASGVVSTVNASLKELVAWADGHQEQASS